MVMVVGLVVVKVVVCGDCGGGDVMIVVVGMVVVEMVSVFPHPPITKSHHSLFSSKPAPWRQQRQQLPRCRLTRKSTPSEASMAQGC